MKKLLCIAVLVGVTETLACHSAPTNGRAGIPSGAPTAEAAIHQFFDAARVGDLQAMSVAWGTTQGATRDHMDRAELEKRTVILQCYFNSDSYKIMSASTDEDGTKSYQVQLTRGSRTRTTAVHTVQGPAKRWYVDTLNMPAVHDFCGSAQNASTS